MRRRDLLALAALAAALFLWRLGTPDFWEPDEPDFALISREMLQSGDWVVPTRNGAAYAEKPPLLYWMVAGLGRLTGCGVNGWTARLPSALCAVAAVLAVYAAGCRWLSPEAARWAALALMTMPLWILKARYLLTDMPFAALITLALLGLARPLVEGRAPAGWGFVALGLAVLAKGPLAGALLVAALAGGGILLRRNPLRFAGRWALGAMLVLLVAAPWYLAVWQRAGSGFLREVLLGQNLRFVQTGSHHRPFWYYAPALLYDLLPWCLPLLAAVPAAWRARRESPAAALALAWTGGMLLLLSASAVKQEKYLLPLLPGAALLTGWWLARSPAALCWTGRLAAGILALLAAVLGLLAWGHPPLAGASGGLALAALLCALAAPRAPASALAAFYLAAVSLALPAVDALKSARAFSAASARRAGAGPLAYYGEDLQAAYPFYAGRRVDYVEADRVLGAGRLEAYLRARPEAVLMLRRRDLEALPPGLSSRLRVEEAWRRDFRAERLRWLDPGRPGRQDMLAVRLAEGGP